MAIRLEDFDVSREHGFLGPRAQWAAERLPVAFEPWEQILDILPKLLLAGRLRERIERLEELPIAANSFSSVPEWKRAMLVLSMLAHAYVFQGRECGDERALVLPAALSRPWFAVAAHLQRPPVLACASIAHDNFGLIDSTRPVTLDNMVARNLFLGSSDEAFFYLQVAAIEADGAPAVAALVDAVNAVRAPTSCDHVALRTVLLDSFAVLQRCICAISSAFSRMTVRCLPEVFCHRIRHFLNGWADGEGLVYAEAGPGRRDLHAFYTGGSGAQSPLFQAIDAGLGIEHHSQYLLDVRRYMPPRHRALVEALEAESALRRYVLTHAADDAELLASYNAAVAAVTDLRSMHLRAVCRYVILQQDGERAIGTGGTEVMPFLRGIRDSTKTAALSACPFAAEPTPKPRESRSLSWRGRGLRAFAWLLGVPVRPLVRVSPGLVM